MAGPGEGLIPDDLRVMFSVSATVEILAWWLGRGAELDIERMAEILDRLVVGPSLDGGVKPSIAMSMSRAGEPLTG